MTAQPEALRLAELLEHIDGDEWRLFDLSAAELRRLYDVNQELLVVLRRASGELYRASSYCNTYDVLGEVNETIMKTGEQP